MRITETDLLDFFICVDADNDGMFTQEDLLKCYSEKYQSNNKKNNLIMDLFIYKDKIDVGMFNYFASCENGVDVIKFDNFQNLFRNSHNEITLEFLRSIKKSEKVYKTTMFYFITNNNFWMSPDSLQDAFLYSCDTAEKDYLLNTGLIENEETGSINFQKFNKVAIYDIFKKYICLNEFIKIAG